MSPRIFSFVLLFLMVDRQAAVKVRFGSTRGCDISCQKECIEVINKYRTNHGAAKVKFSQSLADKAQKWADGGKFGYDMKSRGKYGQLIEWDVKDERPSFTSVIKHWHDKGKDFDFALGRSKTGKTLHDFTQIVWKKTRKAGCGQSEMFGSKYFVVWMDADSVFDPRGKTSALNIGPPKREDIHWFESQEDSTQKASAGATLERPQDEKSSYKARVELKSPLQDTTGVVRSEENKPNADLNEVQDEQRVLNNNAILKQYLYHDNLNNIVLNENRDTASYHVVTGSADNAAWQKTGDSLVQLEKRKNDTEKAPDNIVASFPLTDEEDNKQAAALQNLVKQEDDVVGKEEDKTAPAADGTSSDEVDEGEENQQAAVIQSMMKQEDEMIQRQGTGEEAELASGGGSPAPAMESPPSDSNHTGSVTTGHEFTRNANRSTVVANATIVFTDNKTTQVETNSSLKSVGRQLSHVTSKFPDLRNTSHDDSRKNGSLVENNTEGASSPSSFFSAGVALNFNPSDSITSSNGKRVKGPAEVDIGAGTHVKDNDSLVVAHDPSGTLFKGASFAVRNNESQVSSVHASQVAQNYRSGNQFRVSEAEHAITQLNKTMSDKPPAHSQPQVQDKQEAMAIKIRGNSTAKEEALTGGLNSANRQLLVSSFPKPNDDKPYQSDKAHYGFLNPKVTDDLSPETPMRGPEMSVGGITQGAGSPHQSEPLVGNQLGLVVTSGYRQTGDTAFHQEKSLPSVQGAALLMEGRIVKTNSAISDVHHVPSPAVITLPSAQRGPIKLVFHVNAAKTATRPSTTGPYSAAEFASSYQSKLNAHSYEQKMNDEECHDDTLQCHLWAEHGHCRGTAYAEFMKRHCTATCGYCAFPSMIKKASKEKQTAGLVQDAPCEDAPGYEFSCLKWHAQGYCEKKPKEMRSVCKKTCGFCVPKKTRPRLGTVTPNQPVTNSADKLNDKGPRLIRPQVTSKTFNISPTSTRVSSPLVNKTKDFASSKMQNLQLTSRKEPVTSTTNNLNKSPAYFAMKPFRDSTMKQNGSSNPLNSSRIEKPLKPLRDSAAKQNGSSDPMNSSEVRKEPRRPSLVPLLKITFDKKLNFKSLTKTPSSLALMSGADLKLKQSSSLNVHDAAREKNASSLERLSTTVQETGAKSKVRNGTRHEQLLQLSQKISDKLPGEQRFTAATMEVPITMNWKSYGGSNPRAVFSLNKKPSGQKFFNSEEDKVIQDGLKALQQKLQVPIEISAVAKSSPECGQRLCKEKVKTQQAKTRENIGSETEVPQSSYVSQTEDKPVSTGGCDASCQRECLRAHNAYRANHGAPPLTLDQTLANQAQQWADKKVFKHSPWAGGQGGETIALGSLYPSFTAAVKAWHDEEKDYDWTTGTGINDMKVNHFTQVVWKRAKRLGCGRTQVNGEPYYIAQMDIPGVIAREPGYKKSNVGEPKEPDLKWFMDSSPYWREMQLKDSIPKDIEHYIL